MRASAWICFRLLACGAIGPTLIALVMMAVLLSARDLASLQAEVGVLLALTFPHAGVVWALDRRESARQVGRHQRGSWLR